MIRQCISVHSKKGRNFEIISIRTNCEEPYINRGIRYVEIFKYVSFLIFFEELRRIKFSYYNREEGKIALL